MKSSQQFPHSKGLASGPSNARRDRGANNKRLPGTGAELVSSSAPIARHTSEVHETPDPTRDGDGVPTNVLRGQLPGCLPAGYTLDSLLTVQQFATWRQKSEDTVRDELPTTKGALMRNRKDVRIHPRTYLENSVKATPARRRMN